MTFQDDYNRAIRATEEEELAKVRGTWVSEAKIPIPRKILLELIQDRFNEEFQQLRDFLDGKTEIPEGTDHKWACRSIKYLESPETFEKDIAELEPCGDLSAAEQAWIKNTRSLIKKYHGIVYALENGHQIEEGAVA